jgi:hypothetical protein
MEQRDKAALVGDENRNAVGNRNREDDSPLGREMTVRFACAQKSFPAAAMCDDGRTVNLSSDYGSASEWRKLILKTSPSGHYFADRISSRQAERARFARRRERPNSKPRELGNILVGYRNSCRHLRLSATRSTEAPSSLRR